MDFFQETRKAFWSEKFWLLGNVTWSEFKYTDDFIAGDRHAHPSELIWVVPSAVILLLLRFLWTKFVLKPIARGFNLKEMRTRHAENIPTLQKSFRNSKRPSDEEVTNLSKKLDLDKRQIQRWFRIRRNQQKSSVMKKFCEGGWKMTFHTCAFSLGAYALWNEDLFTYPDRMVNFVDWHHQYLKPTYQLYYMLEMGHYLSQIVSLFHDVRRHDHVMMTFHHVLTLLLMAGSWSINQTRIGCVILFTHDFADITLELCKILKYAKKDTIAYVTFVIFYISWLVSRLYYYPRYVVYPAWNNYLALFDIDLNAVFIMIIFVTLLQAMHVAWTIMISKMILTLVVNKETTDSRSDSEAEESDSSENAAENNGKLLNGKYKNGHEVNGNENIGIRERYTRMIESNYCS